jgi:HEAT repeat protein
VPDDVLFRLIELAGSHDDALVREASIAALGAIGDERGLPAILAGCTDKPAVRRRAVLALAPFEGFAVDAALAAALVDRDWQVRQAAEDLTRE